MKWGIINENHNLEEKMDSEEEEETMKIVKEFILRDIAGEYVLVPTGETSQEFNGFITISDTARFIWENIEKTDNFEELVKLILNEYEIDEETAARDTAGMVRDLLANGFIALTKEDKSW